MIIKYLLAATAAISFATPALAEDYRIPQEEATRRAAMRTETAFVILSAADLLITVSCIEAKKCTEANPLAKSHSTGTMIGIKSALTIGHYLFVKRLADRNPRAALRVAQISVAVQGTVVGLNIKTVF